VAQASAVSEQLAEVYATYRQEQERNRQESDELERMARQVQSEVEKLAQREVSAASQLRSLLANIDRYSKDDIRSVFTLVQEAQLRLLSMRSQHEQLQLRQKALRERRDELEQLVEIFGQFDASAVDVGFTDAVAPMAHETRETRIVEVIQAQENERLRISLQMHDGPVQTLSNLILRAEICERLIDRDAAQARAELASLKKAVHATLQETRRFIFDLRPMILDDLGLVPTLRRYAQDFTERFHIPASVVVQNMDARLPSHYEVALFRFIQEALNNVHKHANASTVRVLIERTDEEVQIAIEDNGAGFAVNDVLRDGDNKGRMGFAMMRQQIETLLQGKLGVESVAGRGTRVVASVPLLQSTD
jgi:two-component system, NarL family, sensor histidine kinase DegS